MKFTSKKIQNLPPYLFSVIHEKKTKLQSEGVDVIDLGIGAPDLPTPPFIVNKLIDELKDEGNFKYSTYTGSKEYRQAVAYFYNQQYGVKLDADTEILTLIGSKEGISNVVPAIINRNETVLIPDPGYPVYRTATYLAGGKSINLPLDPLNNYRPLFKKLSKSTCRKAKLMFLNYPGNPHAATVEIDVFEEAVSFAKKHKISIAHDSAYSQVTFDGYKAPSVLEVNGAKDISVEFGSLSKSYNMSGWRIGYVVGNKEIIQALSTIKSNSDTSQFLPIQKAAAEALESDQSFVNKNNLVYKGRMTFMIQALKTMGFDVMKPRGTFFIWAPTPKGYTSVKFAEMVLESAGVVITPGSAFGPSGEGYFRISLTVPMEKLKEVVERMKKMNWNV